MAAAERSNCGRAICDWAFIAAVGGRSTSIAASMPASPAARCPAQGPAARSRERSTPEQIWHLVDYVRSLPYENASKPHRRTVENPQRDRAKTTLSDWTLFELDLKAASDDVVAEKFMGVGLYLV